MKRKGSLLIISILCAMVTTYLIYMFLQQKVKEASPKETTRTVIVAATTIPPHTIITDKMVKPVQVHWKSIHSDAVTDMSGVVGMVSLQTFVEDEVILRPKVAKVQGSNLFAMQIPDGLRAMSISYSNVKGAGGLIVPGDRVDVLVAYTAEDLKISQDIVKVTLQNIPVLAVGKVHEEPIDQKPQSQQSEGKDDAKKSAEDGKKEQGGSTITLAVTPSQAESLGFAESYGEIRLLLRAPQDKKNVNTFGVQTNTALMR
ncbi:Flp pilus assembly protein CpaB [Brevibacillus sp. H7]|uniref:Flp pilus assembly protein CpaB n=1 Tax=Brevibacillus sp. H7 TaxID=3349138 RepID=UPI0038169BC1